MTAGTCATCHRPEPACVCDRIVRFETTKRVLILQHPQEKDAVLGTAQILLASLPNAKLVVGLSWRGLAAALGEEEADARRWAVLFPQRESSAGEVATPDGTPLDAKALTGIVVLDGTWSKAKTLWWRNPWLTKLSRLTLQPTQASIYGRLRAEPRREYVSTLESVGHALTLCGEPPEIEATLQRVLRTLVQRVRDGQLVPSAARTRPKRRKPPRPPPKAAAGSDE